MRMKKKMKLSALTVLFAMLLGFAVISIGTEQACAMGGNGSAENPFKISTYADLKEFADIVNGTHSSIEQNTSACAILTEDIVCTDKKWIPIGSRSAFYTGIFEGNGKTIRGLSNKENKELGQNSPQGLFGMVGSDEEVHGEVHNVGLEDIYIHGTSLVGGVAGINTGTISSCHITGKLESEKSSSGGVAGRSLNGGTIENCYNIADVRGSGHFTGGVAGYNENTATISNCYNSGDVSGTSYVGGVTGCNLTGSIEDCYNTGNVSGTDTEIGGVAGINTGTIENCYNTGDVSGTEGKVGGAVGFFWMGTMKDCYNTGDIDGGGGGVGAGGVVGAIESGEITNCYNVGNVTGGNVPVNGAGGVIGWVQIPKEGTITYCYYDKTRCGCNHAIGYNTHNPDGEDRENVKGLTTEQMTGDGALSRDNMLFVYGTGESSPWMTKANDTNAKYYPHLKGFNFDDNGNQMDAKDIPIAGWPPIIHDHTWDSGKETKKATEKATGIRTYTCTAEGCGATRTEIIPKLKPSAPKVSGTLTVKMKAGKKSMNVSWNKIQGAAGYDIFFAQCNHSHKKIVCKKVKTIKGNKTFKWTRSGLKKGTAYKAYIKAYVYKNGKKSYVRTSPMMHSYTANGTRNYTNAKSVTIKNVKKGKLSLKKGKTFKIQPKVNKVNKKKKLMSKVHAPALRYMTTNKEVATVNSSGKITAKGKGTCTVIAFAHNGVSKQIKVTVK